MTVISLQEYKDKRIYDADTIYTFHETIRRAKHMIREACATCQRDAYNNSDGKVMIKFSFVLDTEFPPSDWENAPSDDDPNVWITWEEKPEDKSLINYKNFNLSTRLIMYSKENNPEEFDTSYWMQ